MALLILIDIAGVRPGINELDDIVCVVEEGHVFSPWDQALFDSGKVRAIKRKGTKAEVNKQRDDATTEISKVLVDGKKIAVYVDSDEKVKLVEDNPKHPLRYANGIFIDKVPLSPLNKTEFVTIGDML